MLVMENKLQLHLTNHRRYWLDINTPIFSCVPGNIRVFCRVRPVSQVEQDSADARTMLSFDSDDDAILYLSNKGKIMTFELDKVFPPQASQEEVSGSPDGPEPGPCHVLETICSWLGNHESSSSCAISQNHFSQRPTVVRMGVTTCLLYVIVLHSGLFDSRLPCCSRRQRSIIAKLDEAAASSSSVMENPTDKLDIKMNPDGSGQLYVPGLTEIVVQSPEDINNVFELGHVNRATACTNLNEHSSRSHALLIITVSGFNSTTGTRTQGVDQRGFLHCFFRTVLVSDS
ncbi:hypothetical protein XENOCAPTIV_013564 [Xenoophorus captivus]|uniref:Kinesin motor domain-containing protein n=1 Tax=Xenoophorus captivus TaxID=1517983 RepID=A0ABV0QE78_9TELE